MRHRQDARMSRSRLHHQQAKSCREELQPACINTPRLQNKNWGKFGDLNASSMTERGQLRVNSWASAGLQLRRLWTQMPQCPLMSPGRREALTKSKSANINVKYTFNLVVNWYLWSEFVKVFEQFRKKLHFMYLFLNKSLVWTISNNSL